MFNFVQQNNEKKDQGPLDSSVPTSKGLSQRRGDQPILGRQNKKQ